MSNKYTASVCCPSREIFGCLLFLFFTHCKERGPSPAPFSSCSDSVLRTGVRFLDAHRRPHSRGKAGELNIRLEYLKAVDTRIRPRGTKGKEGQGKVGAAVALTVFFG